MAKDEIKKAAELLKNLGKSKSEQEAEKKKERDDIVRDMAHTVTDSMKPLYNAMLSEMRRQGKDTVDAISKVQVLSQTPNVVVPDIAVPKAEVTVRSPRIEIPEIKMPEYMDVKGFVQLMGVDIENPLPVQLRDAKGTPVDFTKSMMSVMNAGGGGKADYFTIKDIRGSSASMIDQVDGALKVTGSLSATLSADTGSGEIGSDTLRTVQATDAISSVNVVSTVGLTDTELRASSFNVGQVSGANWSTEVTNTVTVDGSGVTQPVSGTVAVSGITNTTAVSMIDSTGVQYSGSNPVPVTATVTGTPQIQGTVANDGVDGDNPIKTGGKAYTTQPTAVASGDRVDSRYDVTGRQVMTPIQVRDLRATAYVSLSTGTETTLLSATAGSYHDLVWIMGANQSDVAVSVDIRMVTGGNVVMSLEIPANGTAGIAPPVPYPQSDSGNNWTVDMGDITGTTVNLTALFSTEI